MAAPLSPTKLLVCPGCQAKLPAENLLPGQKCRCGNCGKLLVVPGEKESPPTVSQPELFGFGCRVCETRLIARKTDVGKHLRCPDCGARNEVPRPLKPEIKKTPEAMFGEQYGVWGIDDSPTTEDLKAHQPFFFPVYCRVCDTLMHARLKQVGQSLTCPDCGAKTQVPPPLEQRPKESVLVPDGEEYQLEEPEIDMEVFDESEPKPEPIAEPKKSHREELREEFGERPKLPTFPLIQGVGKMFFRMPLPAWWLGISAASCFAIFLLFLAVGSFSSSYGAISGLFCVAAAGVICMLAFLALSALCVAIITDTSEGSDKLYNAPDANVIEWFGAGFYVGMAMLVSAIPGALIGDRVGLRYEGATIAFYVLFPIVLLSMLEIGSPFGVLSPKLLASLVSRPVHWLAFYLITGTMTATVYVGLAFLPPWPLLFLLFVPLLLGLELLYYRLLGRLAWWLAESLPAPEPPAED